MMRGPVIISVLVLAAMVLLSDFSRAQMTKPANPREGQIAKWIDQLTDADPETRESATESLMGLTRDELPLLHQLAIKSSPLLPSQITALHDVVKQVYLSGENEKVGSGGFMGIRWPTQEILALNNDPDYPDGLPVEDRIPGFPGYRFLHDGDLITGVENHPEINAHSVQSFVNDVRLLRA